MSTALLLRASLSLAFVLGLLALLAWGFKRGALRLGPLGRPSAIAIETATALGERRSLVIVSVEGRRLLLGLAPGSVTLVTDLAPSKGEGGSR